MSCDRQTAINSSIELQCFMRNTDLSLHTGHSKLFMSGNLHEEIAKELCASRMKLAVWRSAKAADLMDVGDPEPSHSVKCQTREKGLGIRGHGPHCISAVIKI